MDRRLFLFYLATTVPACATDGGARGEVVTLRRQVDQLRAKSIRDLRTIRELENRVFVLEDRLQTDKGPVARIERAPSLPVVTRQPAADAAPRPAAPAPPSAHAGGPPEEQVEIVYEGDALVSTPSRPRLSLDESGWSDGGIRVGEAPARRARRARSAAPLPDPAVVTEKIPVMPVPDAPPRRPGDDPA